MFNCYRKSNGLLSYLPLAILFALFLSFGSLKAQDEELFIFEGFEDGALPFGWSQEHVFGAVDWTFPSGTTGQPNTAHGGEKKAMFQPSSYAGYTTKLITPAINFGVYTNEPTLNFWHAQRNWSPDQDELRIYYRLSANDDWILLAEYLEEVYDWTEKTIVLPEVSNTVYIAFEAAGYYGRGVHLDDVIVYASTPLFYCATLSDCSLYWIQNLAFGIIDNESACANGYSDYTEIYTDLTVGEIVPITVTPNEENENLICGIWIDWNQNIDFTDEGEFFELTYEDGLFTGDVLVPATAMLGNTRLRVRMQNGNINPVLQPCGPDLAAQGEVEDYTVNVLPKNMEYVSSTTTQAMESVYMEQGVENQEIIGIEVVTDGQQNPISITYFEFGTDGTTSLSDIQNVKLWFTGTSNEFEATYLNLLCETINPPTVIFTMGVSVELLHGTNYFWLTYDIAEDAAPGNFVNAQCTLITVDGQDYEPTVTSPGEGRQIAPSGPQSLIIFEDFSSTTFPPAGWSAEIGQGNYNWERVTSGTSPTCSPNSDPAMVRYYSYLSPSGNFATLFSPTLDLSNRGAKECPVSFWTYRYSSSYQDKFEVYVNTTASLTGATLLGTINVSTTLPPVESANGWYEYTFNIPVQFNGPAVVMFKAVSAYGYSMHIDDISITTYPSDMEYVSSTTTQAMESVLMKQGAENQEIIGIEVVTNGQLNPVSITDFSFTTNGTSSLSDIQNAKLWYTGTSNEFETENQFGETVGELTAAFNIAGNLELLSGTNYFWLTYDIAEDATPENFVNTQCTSIEVAGQAHSPTVTNPGAGRQIAAPGPEPTIFFEDFTSETFPPLGWAAVIGQGTYNWERVTTGTSPACSPHSDPAMVRYYSYLSSSGNYATLFTPTLDLSNRGAEDCPVSFWTYRYSSSYQDKFEVYVNTTASLTGATLLGTINVSTTLPPVESSNGWYEYTFYIPPEFNDVAVVMFKALSNYGYSMHIDDISIATFPSVMEYVSCTTTQIDDPLSQGAVEQAIIGIEVVTTGELNPLSVTNFNITSNGTTSLSDIQNAKLWYTGISNEFEAVNQFGETLEVPTTTFEISGEQELASATNYFWLTFDIPENAVNNHWVDAGCLQVTVDGEDYTPTVTQPQGARQIQSPFSGVYTIGADGDYPSLEVVFTDIALLGLSGDVELSILENQALTAPLTINPWNEVGVGGYYLTIKAGAPDVTIERTATTEAVIILNSVDRVIIDGEFNEGERNLTIRNNATSGTNAVIWLKSLGNGLGCEDVTIKNTSIIGANTTESITTTIGIYAGGTTVSTSGTGADHDNLTIQNNHVQRAYYGINVLATSAGVNDNLNIIGNEVGSTNPAYFVWYRGINISYANAPVIANNYLHDLRLTVGSTNSAIEIGAGCGGALIKANRVIGVAQASSGGWGAYGINISTATGNNDITIVNNEVADISTMNYSVSSTTYNPFGIRIVGGTNIKVWHNSVNLFGYQGSAGSAGSLSAAFLVTSTSVTGLDLRNNVFTNSLAGLEGSVSYAICVLGSATSFTDIDYNDYYASGPYGVLGHIGTSYAVGNNKTTLGAWQTATTQDFDSKSEDPEYTANNHLLPTSTASPLVFAATPIPEVTDDILGNERGLLPTIGAYEVELIGLMPPVLVSPLNNSYAVPRRAQLTWEPVESAQTYQIQIATDENFNNVVAYQIGILTTSYTQNAQLAEVTKYFWRVKGISSSSGGNWSQAWSFITQGTLAAPVSVYPQNAAANLHSNVEFVWNEVTGANKYTLQVSESNDFSDILYEYNDLTVTSQMVTGLELVSKYYWRVNATNGVNTSPWSSTRYFSTGAFATIGTGIATNTTTGYPAPYGNYYYGAKHQILVLASEIYAAGGFPGALASLSLNVANLNNSLSLDDFEIKLKETTATALDATWETDGFTSVYYNSSLDNTVGWNAHIFNYPFPWDGISNILIDICFNNTTYSSNQSTYYTTTPFNSVRYYRGDNTTVCSAPGAATLSADRPNILFGIDFGNIAPPKNISPANGAFYQTLLPFFEFREVEGAISYGLLAATDPAFTNIVIDEPELSASQYQVPAGSELQPLTTYYWKANATDGYDISPWSAAWSFVTDGNLSAPTLLSPANNATEVSASLILDWTNVFTAALYQVQIAFEPSFTHIVVDDFANNSNFEYGLEMSSTYYWRVRAGKTNFAEPGPWSETWEFSTGTSFQAGTGTLSNSTTSYPAPYGNWYQGAKHQILVLASELNPDGSFAGNLTSLSFDIAAINTTNALTNFEIRMKPTTDNILNTTWDNTGFTTVYFNPSLSNVLGLNTHTFNTPFYWDGVSNILVDVCFNNTSYGYNQSTYYTTTPFNSVRYYRADNQTVCTSPGTATVSPDRPNMIFGAEASGGLAAPYLIAPRNEEKDVLSMPLFDWTNVPSAAEYQIQVASDVGFTDLAIDETTTSSNYSATELEFGTNYYWRVKSISGDQSSQWTEAWAFETEYMYIVGEGTNSNGDSQYPAPYGNKYMGAKHQILYRASEFIESGFMPGEIYGIAFDVAATNDCGVLNNFSIKMKAVMQNAITNFDNSEGWVEVVAPTNYTPVLGWNMHRFDTPFVWDGVSNVLVQTCFYTPSRTYNASTYYTTTSFNSVALKNQNGNPNICDATSASSVSTNRPNIGFIGKGLLAAPTLLSPLNNAINVPVFPTFNWQAAGPESIVRYSIIVSENEDFTGNSAFAAVDIQGTTIQAILPLKFNTVYYWKLMASIDEEVVSDWSEVWSFTTQLGAPTLAQPLNNAKGVVVNPTLSWNALAGAATYQLQVSLDSDFSAILINQAGLNNLSYLLSNLALNTNYYWRVRATDNLGNNTNWSEIRNFTTLLVAPTLVSPLDDVVSIPLDPVLTWTSSADANQYQVQVLTGYSLDSTVYDFNTISLSAGIQGLEPSTWYAWRVRAKNTVTGNFSNWATMWLFLTQLAEPTLLTPANNAGGVSYTAAQFTWENVPDADYYYFELASDSEFDEIIESEEIEYYNNYQVNNLSPNTQYFWRVQAYDDWYENYGPWSQTFSFTTAVGPVTLLSPVNNAIRQSLNPTFEWEAIEGATYQIQASPYAHFGVTPINVTGLTTNSYYAQNALMNNHSYFWKVRASKDGATGPWSETFTFLTEPADYTPWTVNETNNSSTIIVPKNVVSLIKGRSIATGDAIGLFYENIGTLACAGYGVWDGNELQITVYGDDPNTEEKDGYSIGETYLFKVWDNVAKDIYNAEAIFASGPDNYQTAAVSVLESLEVITSTTQSIELISGWNMISSYLSPTNPSVVNIFAPIASNVRIVKNSQGQQYIPQWNINSINNWNIRHGYLVYMLAAEELEVTGEKIDPVSTPIYLQQGWRISSYLRDNPIAAPVGFASIYNQLIVAKSGSGDVYIPQFNINTIGDLMPGEGYNLYVSATAELVYPSNVVQLRAGINEITPLPKHLIPTVKNTGNDATLVLDIGESFNNQEVGVWNSRNELIGSAVVNNGYAGVNIWGNNELSENDEGAAEGEFLLVKVYNPTDGQYTDISLYQINEIVSGTNPVHITYTQDAIYFAKAIAEGNALAGDIAIKNIPNPATASTIIEFSLPSDGDVEIELYSLSGQKIASIIKANFKAGVHTINFDVSNLTSGTYNLVLRSGSLQANQIMLIVK